MEQDKKTTFVEVVDKLTDNFVIFIVIGVMAAAMFIFPELRKEIVVAFVGALNLIIGKLFGNKNSK